MGATIHRTCCVFHRRVELYSIHKTPGEKRAWDVQQEHCSRGGSKALKQKGLFSGQEHLRRMSAGLYSTNCEAGPEPAVPVRRLMYYMRTSHPSPAFAHLPSLTSS